MCFCPIDSSLLARHLVGLELRNSPRKREPTRYPASKQRSLQYRQVQTSLSSMTLNSISAVFGRQNKHRRSVFPMPEDTPCESVSAEKLHRRDASLTSLGDSAGAGKPPSAVVYPRKDTHVRLSAFTPRGSSPIDSMPKFPPTSTVSRCNVMVTRGAASFPCVASRETSGPLDSNVSSTSWTVMVNDCRDCSSDAGCTKEKSGKTREASDEPIKESVDRLETPLTLALRSLFHITL